MYETHFGLRERPFRSGPDDAAYYPASTHETALSRLLDGIRDGEGVLLLTGEPGAGKTLLCHRLLERLGPDLVSAFLPNSHCETVAALLQAILFELSLPYEGKTPQEMRLALTDFLLKTFAAGRRTLLIVDEAQHLPAAVLEEIRLLGNLEARGGKAVQVVLVGQPALLDGLRRPELAALRQRLAVRCTLEPLGAEEATDYLLHHLRAAGGRPDSLLGEEALQVLARGARGVPRLLSQSAHMALTLACEAGVRQVDAEAAIEALTALGLEDHLEGAPDDLPSAVGDPEEDVRLFGPPMRRA
jgi:type II secretory pathway predicted ATPase ExeA